MTKVPMTTGGAVKLREELHHLKSVMRPKIILAIAEARGHGDLRENAEYHAAKEQQGFVEGRIREIEYKLGNSQIIDITELPNEGRVVFGATVTLENVDTEQTVMYQIVGEDEADLKAGKISIGSPIARGVIGKQEGDKVDIHTPNGIITYEILKVNYI